MFDKPFTRWLTVLLAILGGGAILRAVLDWRDLHTAARIVDVAAVALASAWCYVGLHLRWDRHWAWRAGLYLVASNLFWAFAAVSAAVGRHNWAFTALGIWGLAALALLGVAGVRALCTGRSALLGIARTVIDQAQRMYVVLFIVVAVVVILIALPSWQDETEWLNRRLTFYIEWSLRLSISLLSIMTAVLACYTITYDLKEKQMFMLATKPVSRFTYLMGKWVGLGLLNLVLIAVVGVGVWLGARLMYAEPIPDSAAPELHRAKLLAQTEVMTARVVALPEPPPQIGLRRMVQDELDKLRKEVPQLPDTVDKLDANTLGELRGKALAAWHSIPPRSAQVYLFSGFKPFRQQWLQFASRRDDLVQRRDDLAKQDRMEEAMAVDAELRKLLESRPITTLRLRIRPKNSTPSPDEKVRMGMQVGNYRQPLADMPNDTVREIAIAYELIDENGDIVIALFNVNTQNPAATHNSNIRFETMEGIQLIYETGSFEGNVVAAMIVHWFRLLFLAMVGIACGTFLGFPMACLTTIFIYLIASFSGYAGEALASYTPLSVTGKSWWGIFGDIFTGLWMSLKAGDFAAMGKLFIKLLGDVVIFIIPSFSYYNPTPLLADGKEVSLRLVGESALYVGLVWTGVCAFIGWFLYRKRELARVTV